MHTSFSPRLHAIIARCMPSPVRLSVRHTGGSVTVEVRITQPSPQSDSSFLVLNFTVKFQKEDRERGRRMTQG